MTNNSSRATLMHFKPDEREFATRAFARLLAIYNDVALSAVHIEVTESYGLELI